ncbi:hypothetical protein [Pseudoalteromonas ruthenica]|uniref:hypothetical protein n=1 Tax=Pseudoalteromonas ruthenica TaxID=151081 RepID=UPI00110AFD8C|nr:hypothetical protein [Pseudoalteromonas ruthenica]TMO87642.1 hypothetical protein CWC12_10195 [Pseudoalteromonas ruthenica]TMP22281.1 hypothetical protein CWC06_15815 [Pseudoalteromonas ruthenica]
MDIHKLTPRQKGLAIKLTELGTSNRYIMIRPKGSKSAIEGVWIVDLWPTGDEKPVAQIRPSDLEKFLGLGVVEEAGSHTDNATLYCPSAALKENSSNRQALLLKLAERVTEAELAKIAARFGCKVNFDSAAKLFSVERLDGTYLESPYIDVSLGGVKVTAYSDLTPNQWHDEISEVLRRSFSE